ncbi:hypothetical protein [Algibacter pectinivorans]|uniref:Thrombospondin type 3 repeat-containing protein n=1 Tax=Algibacter pectinivorans TaxID=870482 RepID=A0A1I1RK91_9FLAO|nr:hypothetical protein [Algibacter pectinivorans]SFD34729.1 hypothetical protein SAMN04487987_11063 [Algibacter pectinivorans]
MKTIFKCIIGVFLFSIYFSCDESTENTSGISINTEDFTINAPLVVKKLDTLGFLKGSSNKGEVTFSLISQAPENSVVLGLRYGEIIVESPEFFNSNITDEVILVIEVKKGQETKISNVTIRRNLNDPDGDGVENSIDSDPNNPCLPVQDVIYTGYNSYNSIWREADCDQDGISNIEELNSGTNPYFDESSIGDTDGDGLRDDVDPNPNDPCLPERFIGYQEFDSDNAVWAAADCNGNGVSNGEEFAQGRSPYPFPNLTCNEIFNFELENYARELRTVDSNNGEGVTIGVIGGNCGTILFTGGSIFNQGCFNEDVSVPFFFEPADQTSSNGRVFVELTEYSCLSEDRVSSRSFTVEGLGTYTGASSTIELTYIITQLGEDIPDDERVTTGTLLIRPL